MSKITKLCNCGSCEQAIERAIGVAEKMMLDGECSLFLMAVGTALRGIGVNVAVSQIKGVMEEDGIKGAIGELLAREGAINSCTSVDEKIRGVFTANNDVYVEMLNVGITAANKKYEEERNLPKGD